MLTALFDDVAARDWTAFEWNDPRANDFAPASVGNGIHVARRDVWEHFDDALDFHGIDLGSGDIDAAAHSAGQMDSACGIETAQVAGTEKIVVKTAAVELLFTKITGHEGGGTHGQFADFVGAQGLATRPEDDHVDVSNRLPDAGADGRSERLRGALGA